MANIIGMGSEIVECLRIAQMIERHAEQFLQRVFCDQEIAFCNRQRATTQQFASHWAGKRAVLQAIDFHRRQGIRWREIELKHSSTGPPQVSFRGSLRDYCNDRNITQVLVSLSHCRTHAFAHALALTDDKLLEE
jgi:holo-[acyl-carrier protein] synthase